MIKQIEMIKSSKLTHIVCCYVFVLFNFCSCKKFVEADLPIEKATADAIYSNTNSSAAVMSGIYLKMGHPDFTPFGGQKGLTVYPGLAADELTLNDNSVGSLQQAFENSYTYDGSFLWFRLYKEFLFPVNSLIEGITASTGISEQSKGVLLGEGKFLRALMYFYLVNYYGDVPLVLTTDFEVNSHIARSPKSVVYDQIIKDLTDAQSGLNDNYLDVDITTVTSQRVRPNKAAAEALLARVYLYLGQWQKAEDLATQVINDSKYSLLPDLDAVFLKNSGETIWQVQPYASPFEFSPNTLDGIFLIPFTDGFPVVTISDQLLSAFESGDLRKEHWITTVFSGPDSYVIPYKYKAGPEEPVQNEYMMVLRLAEQYLIRAEARAQLGKITGAGSAEEDINAIRARAGIAPTTAATQTEMLDAILNERRVELFVEWGHRWLDLKRTNTIDEVMSAVAPVKGGVWESYKALYPIPFDQLQLNPNFKPQNPGYPSP